MQLFSYKYVIKQSPRYIFEIFMRDLSEKLFSEEIKFARTIYQGNVSL